MTSVNLSLAESGNRTETAKVKSGFWREQRAITSRRLPLAALSILMYFLYDVFGTVMAIQRERAVNDMISLENAIATFPLRGCRIVSNWMGMRGIGFVIGIVGAILLGIQGFAYLYRSQTVDFYESRPEKRSTRFIGITLNSFLIYAVPSFLGVICSFVLAVLNGCAAGWLLAEMITAWCFQTILFLAVYAMSTLASLLTGTVVTAFLMNCYFFGIEALLRLTIHYHRAAYYATFDDAGEQPIISQFWTLPPYHYLIGMIRSEAFDVANSEYHWQNAMTAIRASLPGAACNLLIFAAAIAGAFYVYRVRKAEFAGKAVTYRGLATFIKCTAAVLFSLCAGLFIYWIFDNRRGAELTGVILTIIVTVFVGCMILEAIFGMNIRAALGRIWQAPILAVAALIILFVYRMDVFGYDRWVPAAQEVETAFLVNQDYNLEYWDEDDRYHTGREYAAEHMFLTDIEDMRTLAEISQAEQVKWTKMNSWDDDMMWDNWYATIGWRMKNGRTITRYVQIPVGVDPDLMDRIVGTEEFVRGVYRLDDVEPYVEKLKAKYPRAGYRIACETEHGRRTVNDTDLLNGFLTVYREDLKLHYDFTMASHAAPVGQVTLESNNYYGPYGDLSWPLYECYEDSIAYLEQNGLWKGGFLAPEEVGSVKMTYSRYVEETDMFAEKIEDVTDPDKIREILANSLPMTYRSAWFRNNVFTDYGDPDASVYMEIYPNLDLQWELFGLQSGKGEDLFEDRELREGELTCYQREIFKDQEPSFVTEFVENARTEGGEE